MADRAQINKPPMNVESSSMNSNYADLLSSLKHLILSSIIFSALIPVEMPANKIIMAFVFIMGAS